MVFRLHIPVLPHSLTAHRQAETLWHSLYLITQDQEGPESVLKKLRIFSGKRIFCWRRWCCIRWHTVLQTLQTHQYFWRIHIHFGRTQKFLECDLYLTTRGGGKHHQQCHPPTCFTSCSQWLGVCVLTIFHLKRLFKLLWQPYKCSVVTAIEVITLFCPVLPGRYYLRHSNWKTD